MVTYFFSCLIINADSNRYDMDDEQQYDPDEYEYVDLNDLPNDQ